MGGDDGNGDFSRQEYDTIQSRVSFSSGSDRAHDHDQACTDGDKWFIYADSRGLARGAKDQSSHGWSCEHQHDDQSLKEITMLCHKNHFMIRHRDAPNVPF